MARKTAAPAKAEKRKHAKYAPSAGHRWMVCGGSIPLVESMASISDAGEAASEGTVAHRVHELCLKNDWSADRFRGQVLDADGRSFEVDAEMVDAVDYSLDVIRAWRDESGGTIHVESDVYIPHIGDDGHPDAMVIDDVPELDVFDFKYGKGHAVEATDNDQMRQYGLGALAWAHTRGFRGFDEVRLHIVQPRAPHADGPHRVEVLTSAELTAYGDKVSAQIRLIESGKAPLVPGVDQCRFCPAKATCPALAREAVKAAHSDFGEFMASKPQPVKVAKPGYLSTAGKLTGRDIAQVLARLPLLFLWANAVEVEAVRRIGSNAKDKPPGYKLVEGKANRRWRDTEAAIALLRKRGLALDDIAPRALLGITTIEAMIDRASRDKVMAKLTEKPPGKPTLAPESDPRRALSTSSAIDDFAAHMDGAE